MQWLTAVLAFATTMLVLSLIVSSIVEIIHRIFRLRQSGLELMLRKLYEHGIAPRLATGGEVRLDAATFAGIIMQNRVTGTDPPDRLSALAGWFVNRAKLTDMPVEMFTQKLADSRIVGTVDHLTTDVVQDLAQKFEAFGAECSAYFESRARLMSFVVALLFALCFYVHPYRLANAYFANPELAEAVSERAAAYVQLQAATDAARRSNVGEPSVEALEAALDDMKGALDDAVRQTGELAALGVPIGWQVDDLAACEGVLLKNCHWAGMGFRMPVPSFANLAWLVFGGLLIGLGAPFWAQAVASLGVTRDVGGKIAAVVSPRATVLRGAGNVALNAAPGREAFLVAEPLSPAVAAFELARKAGPG